jgi:hypothetical protein
MKMIDLYKKSGKTETGEELGNAIVQMIEDNLDLERWNFKLSFRDFSKMSYQKVIYDSPYCRFNFSFSRQRLPKYDELSIFYGRLHAPNDKAFMVWQDQECHCWHGMLNHLKFLDELSPQEVVEQEKSHKYLPKVVEKFFHSAVGVKLREEYPPKYVIVLESIVWQRYGKKLFELFDLRRPDLWEGYKHFLSEYYRLLNIKSSYGPPYENVC